MAGIFGGHTFGQAQAGIEFLRRGREHGAEHRREGGRFQIGLVAETRQHIAPDLAEGFEIPLVNGDRGQGQPSLAHVGSQFRRLARGLAGLGEVSSPGGRFAVLPPGHGGAARIRRVVQPPDAGRLTRDAGGQPPSLRFDDEPSRRSLQAGQGREPDPLVHIPEADGPIISRRSQRSSVRKKSQFRYALRMTLKGSAQRFSGPGFVDLDVAGPETNRQKLAVGREIQRIDRRT